MMYGPRLQSIELCLRANRSHQARIPPRRIEKDLGDDWSQQSSRLNKQNERSSSLSSLDSDLYSAESQSAQPPYLVWLGDDDQDATATGARKVSRKNRKKKNPQERLDFDIELTC